MSKGPNMPSYPPTMPSEIMPAYFVDTASNVSSTNQITKITFTRIVFDTYEAESSYSQPAVQIVMSNNTLLEVYAFLKLNVDQLTRGGVYSKEEVEEAIKNAGSK